MVSSAGPASLMSQRGVPGREGVRGGHPGRENEGSEEWRGTTAHWACAGGLIQVDEWTGRTPAWAWVWGPHQGVPACGSSAQGQPSPKKLFGAVTHPHPQRPGGSGPFVSLSSRVWLSARLREADINTFISLAVGWQLGLFQVTCLHLGK